MLSREAKKLGLTVNWGKTELMCVGEPRPIPPPIEMENALIYFVPSFIYLGSKLSSEGSLLPEINRRRGIAAGVMQGLRRPLWRHRNISRRTKMRIYNASVISVLLYGAETWPMNKTLEARLDGFDSRALRQVENINWPQLISNQDLRQRTQQPRASTLTAERRLRWYGHVRRMPPNHPTQILLDFDPMAAGWRRPRRAPRTRWIDVIRNDLQPLGLTLEDAQIIAHDRPAWRRLVSLISSTRAPAHED